MLNGLATSYFLLLFIIFYIGSNPPGPPDPMMLDGYYRIEKKFDVRSETEYYLTRINHLGPDGEILHLRQALSEKPAGEIGSEFAARSNALLAFNASIGVTMADGIFRPRGIHILDGKILQTTPSNGRFILGIKTDNRLVSYDQTVNPVEMIRDGVYQAVTAFTPLIIDSKPVPAAILNSGPANYQEKHPRQVIAQMPNLDLLFLSCGGRGFGGKGMTAIDVIALLMSEGVEFAYMLDGGGSTTTVAQGELITEKIDENGTAERRRPNFLYIPAP